MAKYVKGSDSSIDSFTKTVGNILCSGQTAGSISGAIISSAYNFVYEQLGKLIQSVFGIGGTRQEFNRTVSSIYGSIEDATRSLQLQAFELRSIISSGNLCQQMNSYFTSCFTNRIGSATSSKRALAQLGDVSNLSSNSSALLSTSLTQDDFSKYSAKYQEHNSKRSNQRLYT